MSDVTPLASGQINQSGDTIQVDLIQPDGMRSVVRSVWPQKPTITTPAGYVEVASTAMRLLAEASATLARIKASGRLSPASILILLLTLTR